MVNSTMHNDVDNKVDSQQGQNDEHDDQTKGIVYEGEDIDICGGDDDDDDDNNIDPTVFQQFSPNILNECNNNNSNSNRSR